MSLKGGIKSLGLESGNLKNKSPTCALPPHSQGTWAQGGGQNGPRTLPNGGVREMSQVAEEQGDQRLILG